MRFGVLVDYFLHLVFNLKIIKIKELREKNIPTVPTTIAEEKKLNIFFQANQENIKSLLSDNNISDEEAFTIIRSAKDNF